MVMGRPQHLANEVERSACSLNTTPRRAIWPSGSWNASWGPFIRYGRAGGFELAKSEFDALKAAAAASGWSMP